MTATNQPQPNVVIPWERAAVFISLIAAASFVCSAAFVLGTLYGINRVEVVALLTFADVANNAIAMTAIISVIMATSYIFSRPLIWIDRKLWPKQKTSPLFWVVIALLLVAPLILVWVHYFTWKDYVFLIGFGLSFYGSLAIWHRLTKTKLPKELRLLGAYYLMCLISASGLGVLSGETALKGDELMVVQTKDSTLPAAAAFTLERGVILVEPFGYEFVPWSEVKSLMSIQKDSDVFRQRDVRIKS